MEKQCKTCVDYRKVAVIGCGYVGATSAFSIMETGLFSEMVLIDADARRAEGEAMDINHGLPFSKPMKIYDGGYDDIEDASIIIIAAGANQKPGETRLDLVKKNVGIFKSIIPEIKKRDFKGILLVVANPVDILTYTAWKLSGYPKERVIGSGTSLDTARLKYEIGKYVNVDSRDVLAYIMGEHGDTQFPAWSHANILGVPLRKFCEMRGITTLDGKKEEIAETVKNSAYEIIQRKHATYYGVAVSVRRICEAIARNEHTILPVSSILTGEYGVEGVALSVPTILGQNGVEQHVLINLSDEELKKFQHSADTLKEIIKENNI